MAAGGRKKFMKPHYIERLRSEKTDPSQNPDTKRSLEDEGGPDDPEGEKQTRPNGPRKDGKPTPSLDADASVPDKKSNAAPEFSGDKKLRQRDYVALYVCLLFRIK